jgi:hypothetical protein
MASDDDDLLSLFEGKCGHRWVGATAGLGARLEAITPSRDLLFRDLCCRYGFGDRN